MIYNPIQSNPLVAYPVTSVSDGIIIKLNSCANGNGIGHDEDDLDWLR